MLAESPDVWPRCSGRRPHLQKPESAGVGTSFQEPFPRASSLWVLKVVVGDGTKESAEIHSKTVYIVIGKNHNLGEEGKKLTTIKTICYIEDQRLTERARIIGYSLASREWRKCIG